MRRIKYSLGIYQLINNVNNWEPIHGYYVIDVYYKFITMSDKVLETVVNGIDYQFPTNILVKPLEAIKVTKEFTEQIPTGEKDENGYNLYETKTETKEVESDFAKGIVLVMPTDSGTLPFTVGDTIVYPKKFAKDFDLFKDSQLVKPYDVVAFTRA
jgi:hypothetical protein